MTAPRRNGNVPLGGEFVFLLNDPSANPNSDGVNPFTMIFAGPQNVTPLGGLTISGVPGFGNEITRVHNEDGLVLDTHGLFLGSLVGSETIGGIGRYSLSAGTVNATATVDDPCYGNVMLGAGTGGVGGFDHNNFGAADAIVNIGGPAVDPSNTAAGYGGYLLVGAAPLSFGQYTMGEESGLGLVRLDVENRIDIGGSTLTELSGGFCIADFTECNGVFSQSGGEVYAGNRLGNTGGINLGNGPGVGENQTVGTYELNFGFLEAGVVNVGLFSVGQFSQGSGVASLGTLIVANAAGSQGAVDITGGTLETAYAAIIGNAGLGEVFQSGSSVVQVGMENSEEVGNDLLLGRTEGSLGRCTMSEGDGLSPLLVMSGRLVVGGFGRGEFTQNGGTVQADVLTMASEEGESGPLPGSGQYTLNTGTLVTGNMTIAENGQGLFLQNGGTVTTGTLDLTDGGLFAVEEAPGVFRYFSHGIYQLAGGELNTQATNVGGFGLASFEQSGESVHRVAGNLAVGNQPALAEGLTSVARSGSYRKDGGTLEIGAALVVGGANNVVVDEPGGLGSFVQAGGTTSVVTALVVGQSADIGGGVGTLDITGGELVVGVGEAGADVSIGGNGVGGVVPGGLVDGKGAVNHSGGSFSVQGGLFLSNGNGVGTYTLSGTGALDTLTTVLGNEAALFTQTGGTHDTLFLNVYGGQYAMSGGVVNVAANMGVAGPFADATVNQSGGEVYVNDPTFGLFIGNFGNTGTYTLSGGLLQVAAVTHVGAEGVGVFDNVGAGTHVTGQLLISENELGPGTGASTYKLAGGALQAGSVVNRGTFQVQGSLADVDDFLNQANGVVRGNGTIGGTLRNHGLLLAEAGTLSVTVDGQSGTVQAGTGSVIALTGNSDAAFLDLSGGGLDARLRLHGGRRLHELVVWQRRRIQRSRQRHR